jgi:GNAT superfamily N-acetyltransferase
MISLRSMNIADIRAGLSLCRHSGWNQVYEDWLFFLQVSPEGCFVAVDKDDNVTGTVTTITYEKRFAWIGMVLVDPSRRREGIGTALLMKAIDFLSDIPCIKLDATPAGREVYLQNEFYDEFSLGRYLCNTNIPVNESTSGTHVISDGDMDFISDTDKQLFGADRTKLLASMRQRHPYLAITNENRTAYCFGREGHLFYHIGPVVAQSLDDAKRVCLAALLGCAGRPVIMDITHHSAPWINWVRSIGFSEQRPFTRMFRGANYYKAEPASYFAVAGPEFG